MIDQALRTLRTLLIGEDYFTKTAIENAVDMVLTIPLYASVDRERLLREALHDFTITMDDFQILEGKARREPWLLPKKASIQWSFWNRYRDYLKFEKGFSQPVLDGVDLLTDRILDNLFDPTRENIVLAKKGLVVGQVQSGKTSNYTGLICKAADAGFRFIIVLAGMHNNLRSQTQVRLDEGFLGFDTQHLRSLGRNKAKIGVGNISQDAIAQSLTSSEENGDFSKGAAKGFNFQANHPTIVVVKKNGRILKNLFDWLASKAESSPEGKKIRGKSLLLIDDEADNASINTNKADLDPTKINSHIRSILRLFDKSAYIGYTATPFANIFISVQQEDDLFPRDFIINLPAPNNYIGPERVFGLKPQDEDAATAAVLPIAHCIRDHNKFIPDRHKKGDPKPDDAPDSLRLAIRCFILVCAIRRLRGQTEVHNSMLVHVSRFTDWHGSVKDLVEAVFIDYRNKIQIEWAETMEELRRTFEEDNGEYLSFVTTSQRILDASALRNIDTRTAVHDWTSVRRELNEAAQRILVREINGSSRDALNYFDNQKHGLSVIAIGGDKLSRGLTLEGLSVSYYFRPTKMYDTLMQMGRWFGFRPHYVDLCRLFTSEELYNWFAHIAYASEELRDEFETLYQIGGAPEQFAVKVRTHPGQLQISAANKIRRAVPNEISWAGRLFETYLLSKNQEIIKSNLNALKNFIENMDGTHDPNPQKKDSFLWRSVSVEHILGFLRQFGIPKTSGLSRIDFLDRYIENQVNAGEMRSWNVAIISKKGTTVPTTTIVRKGEGFNIGQIFRIEAQSGSNSEQLAIRGNHVISKTDELVDVSSKLEKDVLRRTIEVWQKKESKKLNEKEPVEPNPLIYRTEFRDKDNPLLLLYLIDPIKSTGQENRLFKLPEGTPPLVAFAIAFPGTGNYRTTQYVVNKELMSNLTELPFDDENDN
jgi:Z1 domain